MSDTEQHAPRAFISYSWSSPDHESWVLDLATQLQESGIDVILDKWDLREGQEAASFMESMVTDETVQKVIIVSDKQYTEKSNQRQGGAGLEAQIISKKLFEQRDQSKFVALIKDRDNEGHAYLPVYYTSRIYIDFCEVDHYSDSFEQLLRWLFDKPFNVRPPLGKRPAFLDDDKNIKLATNTDFMRAQSAIKEGKFHALSSVRNFLDKMIEQLPLLRFESTPYNDYDYFKENLSNFIPYRNQIIEIVRLIVRNKLGVEYYIAIHRFIEEYMYFYYSDTSASQWSDAYSDNFKFWGYELFLYIVAILVREREIEGFDAIVAKSFYVENSRQNDKVANFSDLYFRSRLFKYWNEKEKLEKLSLVSHFIHERSAGSAVRFNDLAQADFILYLRGLIAKKQGYEYDSWYPLLMIYRDGYGPFEIFARATSINEFHVVLRLLGLQNKADFDAVIQPFVDGLVQGPGFGGFDRVHPPALVGYDKLCTRP